MRRAQLERKLKEKVDPTLADQIDLSQEADAFIGYASQSSSLPSRRHAT